MTSTNKNETFSPGLSWEDQVEEMERRERERKILISKERRKKEERTRKRRERKIKREMVRKEKERKMEERRKEKKKKKKAQMAIRFSEKRYLKIIAKELKRFGESKRDLRRKKIDPHYTNSNLVSLLRAKKRQQSLVPVVVRNDAGQILGTQKRGRKFRSVPDPHDPLLPSCACTSCKKKDQKIREILREEDIEKRMREQLRTEFNNPIQIKEIAQNLPGDLQISADVIHYILSGCEQSPWVCDCGDDCFQCVVNDGKRSQLAIMIRLIDGDIKIPRSEIIEMVVGRDKLACTLLFSTLSIDKRISLFRNFSFLSRRWAFGEHYRMSQLSGKDFVRYHLNYKLKHASLTRFETDFRRLLKDGSFYTEVVHEFLSADSSFSKRLLLPGPARVVVSYLRDNKWCDLMFHLVISQEKQ